ncbi:hypothetical protein AAFF_G00323490 [Aldrovandia affinis]|uniref:Uncharacterized protein n=1 Tax=Aldrovandia affinis TaxID=143900 RepID=A0AAD7R6U7_9TELE|nr:hypothetical protein AAFF_G00323490 [Aldrovandia affinis]
MTEMCQQKEQALQQSGNESLQFPVDCSVLQELLIQAVGQVEGSLQSERAFQAHSLRMRAMQEEHEQSQSSYKAQCMWSIVITEQWIFNQCTVFIDFEEIPLLDLTAKSAPSPSTRRHTGSQSWSLLEVEGIHPARRPRRSSLTSMSLSSVKCNAASFLKFFKRS